MESTEASGFPQMDSQHATLVWLSQLKGGPQPLVSPLPPSHAGLGFTSTSPLSSQQSQIALEQKEPKINRLKDSKHRHRNKDMSPTSKNGELSSPSSSRREIGNYGIVKIIAQSSRQKIQLPYFST